MSAVIVKFSLTETDFHETYVTYGQINAHEFMKRNYKRRIEYGVGKWNLKHRIKKFYSPVSHSLKLS